MSGDVVGWRDTLARQFADNAQRWLAGEPLQNEVDEDLATSLEEAVTELSMTSAADLVDGYRDRTISPVDATQAAVDAIERLDPAVNAFVLVDRDGALAAAKDSEARWHAGEPLGAGDGVPTSIKDALLTKGWPTVRGSRLIDASQDWPDDAPSVARLRETGAVILGKTTTPEYSWKGVTDSARFGVTGNPWDPGRTPGGSSGGSATAVGLGMGAWSLGTDGGGSVRIPAAFTGTVALKPTYGLIPLYPPSPFGTLSHVGPMTRTVRDTAALLDVVSGFDHRDWSAMPTPRTSYLERLDHGVAGLRVAYSRTLGFGRNDPEVEAAVDAAVGYSRTPVLGWTRSTPGSATRWTPSPCCGSPAPPGCSRRTTM
jgi:aspartyl-tRNA(Asn)/glutamyl-tRNA(Gln) amidotransferase subunit A